MSASLKGEGVEAQILREEFLSVEETEEQVREFLKKRYVMEGLSTEDYTRLCGLQEALAEETGSKEAEEEAD